MMRMVGRGDKSLIQKDHSDGAYQYDATILGFARRSLWGSSIVEHSVGTAFGNTTYQFAD
jgi:hypothetical protein